MILDYNITYDLIWSYPGLGFIATNTGSGGATGGGNVGRYRCLMGVGI